MCVIAAVKLPRDPVTGKPVEDAKWRLIKIRDRTYAPTYHVKRYTVKDIGASQMFLIDNDTDWTEGVSIHPDGSMLMLVNSALNNKGDKKDDGSKPTTEYEDVSENGLAIRKALKDHGIEKAIEILKSFKFDGNTFISDGDRLFVMENHLPAEVKEKYKDEKRASGKRYEDLVPESAYIVVVREVKDDWLVVRANNGVFNKDAGYQEDDGDSYQSSKKRKEHAEKAIKENVFKPMDLILTFSELGSGKVDKNPWYRPVRLKGLAKSKDHPDIEIFTTSIIQLDPAGTIILKPIKCKLDDFSVPNLVSGKYLANLIVLPERDKIFEGFKSFYNTTRLLK
jgi:hypothetical protein